MTDMKEVREYAEYLKSLHAARNEMMSVMEDMFLLNWSEEKRVLNQMESVKLTKSPNARNTLLGAVRLLIAADPAFSVPHDVNDLNARQTSEKLEKMAAAVWQAAGRVRQDPVHYDVVLSMLLFGETHIAVTRTKDMVEHAKGGSPAARAKAEEIADMTPYVFDVWDPRTGYPEIGPYGLTAYYREVETMTGLVLDEFGADARRQLKSDNRYGLVTLCHFWDYENHYIWLNGQSEPLVAEKHGLPFIPVVVQLGEGSRLFSRPEYWRQPFLYTLWKSGLWSRQNLALTVLYTMLFAVGSNPLFVYQRNDSNKHLELDLSNPARVLEIDPGEQFGPVAKNAIDPSILQGWEIADTLGQQSTIFGQTLGEPLTGSAPYSMVALLHQAGRLPLLVPQRKSSWGIADAVKIALLWMKQDGGKAKAGYGQNVAELAAKDIPDRFEIEAKLEVSLPQDQLQLAQVANSLASGEDPMVSKRWARENVLNIGQSEEMTKEIWGERAANLFAMQFFTDQIQQAQMRMEQAMAAAQQQMMAAQQQQQMMMQQQQGGMPQTGPLPPEQMVQGGPPPGMAGPQPEEMIP